MVKIVFKVVGICFFVASLSMLYCGKHNEFITLMIFALGFNVIANRLDRI